ncbi:MAG: 50S ribosomal protein L4 [Fodinibius sp.]|nr:50S ribosomal protein L4 [Fodinibius sp.]
MRLNWLIPYFGIEPNETVIYEDVRRYMANQRQGTSNTKERGKVRGGGRKAYRQKGTGHGLTWFNSFTLIKGGGTVFGPSPRDYSFRMFPKSQKNWLANRHGLPKLKMRLSRVIDDLSFDEPKTSKSCRYA